MIVSIAGHDVKDHSPVLLDDLTMVPRYCVGRSQQVFVTGPIANCELVSEPSECMSMDSLFIFAIEALDEEVSEWAGFLVFAFNEPMVRGFNSCFSGGGE